MISGITIGLAISLECEPKRQHHGLRPRPSTMPLLAFIRKDTGWRIDWQIKPLGRRFDQPDPGNAFTMALSWPVQTLPDPGSRNRGQRAPLHRLVVGSAAALRRNPGDVAVRVLYVAGFAVDAILGVDLETRAGGFLDPFVNAGRTVAVRRTGKNVVFRCLLQV